MQNNWRICFLGLIPTILRLKPLVCSWTRTEIALNTSCQYLLAGIHDNVERIRRMNNDISYQFDKLKLNLRKEHLDMIQGSQQNVYEEVTVVCKHRLKKKSDLLQERENKNTCSKMVKMRSGYSITLPDNSQLRRY